MNPRTDRTGQVFGDYRLEEFLGQGGFAEVYRGVHVRIPQKQAAVKILIKQLVPTRSLQFQQEAQIIASLSHPNIVSMHNYDFYSTSQTTTLVPFIVMDYVPKGSFRAIYLRRTRLSFSLVATYVQQIGGALQYAHDRGIMHLDVKPENMLMGELGQALLGDFGLARLFSEKDALTDIQGTVVYMAPEQFDVNPGPSFASDQYALAIVAYEWLSGVVPFKGTTVAELHYHHQNTLPPSLTAQVPNLPFAVEAVIMRALKKKPADRYPRVGDFVRELDRAVHQKAASVLTPAVSAWTTPPPAPGPMPGPGPAPMPGPAPTPVTRPAPDPNDSFFRPAKAPPGPAFGMGGPVPAGPNSMTMAQSGLPSFSQQFSPPAMPTPTFQQPVAPPENAVTSFIQEFVQPEPKMAFRRKKTQLYAGLGLHALGAIFIGIWLGGMSRASGNEAGWWGFLLSLAISLGLFWLFSISRNRPLKLGVLVVLSLYWAFAGSAFATVIHIGCMPDATVSFVLGLLVSSGVFLWLLFKKN